jgi:hypothetical protein
VKSRIEAGKGRHIGQRGADGVQRRQGLRLMQRRELGQLLQLLLDVALDSHRRTEALAAVDDPMPHRVGFAHTGPKRVEQLAWVDLCAWRVELVGSECLLARVEQGELHAAGASVDDQDSR